MWGLLMAVGKLLYGDHTTLLVNAALRCAVLCCARFRLMCLLTSLAVPECSSFCAHARWRARPIPLLLLPTECWLTFKLTSQLNRASLVSGASPGLPSPLLLNDCRLTSAWRSTSMDLWALPSR